MPATFIKKYASYLKSKDEKFVIIENEFGSAGVDTQFLQPLNLKITELSGGCICCSLKIKFYDYLVELAEAGYDRIIVEPSGIYNADEFFHTMNGQEVKKRCRIGSVVMIADPLTTGSTEEEELLLMTQAAHAGIILLSKTGQAATDQIGRTVSDIENMFPGKNILTKDWAELDNKDFDAIVDAGFAVNAESYGNKNHGIYYKSLAFPIDARDKADLEHKITRLFDEQCGEIIRIKGFASDKSGQRYNVNCTKASRLITESEYEATGDLNIICGNLIWEKVEAIVWQ